MKIVKILRRTALAVTVGLSALVQVQAQTTPIQFDPNGTGGANAVSVATFDWAPNSTLVLHGNPAGGLTTGAQVVVLSQASLGVLLGSNGQNVAIPPPGTEFT